MKIVFAFLLMCLVTTPLAAHGPASTDWMNGYTLFALANQSAEGATAAHMLIEEHGGRVAIIGPQVLLGWLPDGADNQVLGKAGITHVIHTAKDAEKLAIDGISANLVNYFRSVASGTRRDAAHRNPNSLKHSDVPDVITNDDPSMVLDEDSGDVSASALSFCRYNNCYMIGVVAVGLFFDESVAPEDTYSWDATAIESAKEDVWDALNYLTSQAGMVRYVNGAPYGPHSLSWKLEIHQPIASGGQSATTIVNQGLEPVLHANSVLAVAQWVNPIMANLGYTQVTGNGGVADSRARVKYYNSDLKFRKAATRVLSMFITYTPGQGGMLYSDGGRGWSLLGGPFLQILRNNGHPLDLVVAHEIFHQFWACDEYADYCSNFGGCNNCYAPTEGPRPSASNGNCEVNSCNPNGPACLMKYFVPPYSVCDFTARQVGWTP